MLKAVFCRVPKWAAQMIVQQKLGLTEGSGQLNIPEKQLPRQIQIKVNKITVVEVPVYI